MADFPRLWYRSVGGVAVVAIGAHGAGDPCTTEELWALLERAGGRLVTDLAADEPLTSAVLGKLVTMNMKVKAAGGKLRLCCPPGPTLDELRVAKLDKLVPTFPTLAAALAGF